MKYYKITNSRSGETRKVLVRASLDASSTLKYFEVSERMKSKLDAMGPWRFSPGSILSPLIEFITEWE